MTDDAKQAAWRRFCEQLEAIRVNPHSPEVPEDDPRHEQVQAIVAEYRGIPLPLGSKDGFYQAKYRANQTIRNAHRILDDLGIDDRPERQPPAESLEECEQQFRQLEQWFREKHASGWKPKQAAVARGFAASNSQEAERNPRR